MNSVFILFVSLNLFAQDNSIWKPLKTGAGGWVTGLDIHPSGSPIYARVDVASAYRYNASSNDWINIVNAISIPEEDVYWDKADGVLSIVSAPSNADVAYMAYYNGIYRSSNQGESWEKTNLPEMEMSPNNDESKLSGERLAVDPVNENHIFFGSINEGLWKSIDGGENWELISSAPNGAAGRGIRQVLFDKSSGNINGMTNSIYIFPDENDVYLSTDRGNNFIPIGSPMTNAFYYDMLISDNGDVYVCGEDNNQNAYGIYKYNGTNWTQVFDGSNGTIGELALDPFDQNRLFAFSWGFQNIYRTLNLNDANPSWEPVGIEYQAEGIPYLAWTFTGWFSIGEIAFDPSTEGRIWWADGVGTWTSDNLDDETILLEERAVGQEHLVSNDLVELDNGKVVTAHWDRPLFFHDDLDVYPNVHQPSARFNSSWDLDKSPTDANFLVAVIEDHRYCCFDDETRSSGYSNDGGQTWTQFESQPGGDDLIFGQMAISANDNSNIIWLGEFGRMPYYTTDMGQTWTEAVLPGVSTDCCLNGYWFKRKILVADQVLANTFYVYDWGGGHIFKTTDGGANWEKFSEVLRAWAYNGKLLAVPGKPGHLLFCTGPEQAIDWIEGVSISKDGGQTFTEIVNTDEVLNIAVGKAISPNNYPTIYIYGRVNGVKGFFMTIDEGVKWTFLGDHPLGIYEWPSVMVGDLDDYGTLYVGTNGTGFYYHNLDNALSLDEESEEEAAIEEELERQRLGFSPNPSNGKFQIAYDSPINTLTNALIYDSNGGLVKEQEFQLEKGINSIAMDLSDLSKGVYILQFFVKERLVSKIFVIQ